MRTPTILTLQLSGIMLTGCGSGQKTVQDEAAPTTTATTTVTTEETFPDEGVTSSTKPPTGRHRVGETITLEGVDSGDEVLRVQVARVNFSGGDEFNEPERGLFMGAYIKVKALADDQTSLWGDFYVTTTPTPAARRRSSRSWTTSTSMRARPPRAG
jgi:hypothetical protein